MGVPNFFVTPQIFHFGIPIPWKTCPSICILHMISCLAGCQPATNCSQGSWSYDILWDKISIRRVRFPVNADGAPTFSDGDIFFMNDGGRPGGDWLELIAMLMELKINRFIMPPSDLLFFASLGRTSQPADDPEVWWWCGSKVREGSGDYLLRGVIGSKKGTKQDGNGGNQAVGVRLHADAALWSPCDEESTAS